MIRVLVVDDSSFMRRALKRLMEADDTIKVIDTATNGVEAIEKVKALRPDIVTMDIEMPRMDGITALKQIMKEHPLPVLMVSSLTQEGAQSTIEALQAGAVDFIPKKSSFVSLEIGEIQADLIRKIKTITSSRSSLFRSRRPSTPSTSRPTPTRTSSAQPTRPETRSAAPTLKRASRQASVAAQRAQILTIGVSTGGPFALQKVVPLLPADLRVPVVIVQHMPPHFTRTLAERLNSMSPLRVVEAEQGMKVEAGSVYIAPGGYHLSFRSSRLGVTLVTSEEPDSLPHRPSVDVMFESANATYGGRVLGVIMTGMGRDGLEGARKIKQARGHMIVQDEDSCVVYGMPRAVSEANLADAEVPLDTLAETILSSLRRTSAPASSPSGSSATADLRSRFL